MRNILPTSERDLWWNWAIAELDSTRFGEDFRSLIPIELQTKLRAGRRDVLTQSDWHELKGAVLKFRFPILLDLLQLGIDWYEGELDPSDLPDIRIMNYEPHVRLAPSRTLAAFAAALDAGRNSGENEFGGNYRTVRDTFRTDQLRGRPILVAEATSGPFTLLEGYTRLTVMTSLRRAGKIDSQPIPVLLGVCSRLKEWHLYFLLKGDPVRSPKSLF